MADFEQENQEQEEIDEQEEIGEEESLAQQLAQKKKEIEEKVLKAKLTKILTEVTSKSQVVLLPQQQKTMRDAKKHESLKAQIGAIQAMLTVNKVKQTAKASKFIMAIGPALPYIGIGLLCILLVIICVVFFASLFSYLDSTAGNNTGDSMFGVTGKEFYGVRMVYRDEDLAEKKIVEDYVELVEKSKNEVEGITSVTANGETYSLTLNISLTLPSEEYDYSTFEEASFKTEFATTYDLVMSVAKEVYKADNGTDYAGTSLTECVDGIKYFGYSNILPLSENLINKILETSQISATDSEGATVVESGTISNIKNALTDTALANLMSEFSLEKYTIRTEKLFLKDYILEGDEATVSGVDKQNYVAMIFMPKQAVKFESFSFAVGGTDFTDFEISLTYDGNNHSVTTDGDNLGDEDNKGYLYYTNDLNLSAGVYDGIDSNNLEVLKTPKSLFDLVQETNYSTYLTTETIEGVQLQTFKKSGVVVNLKNSTPFIITEFETMYE